MTERKAQYLGIEIDYNKDRKIPEQGLAMLTGKGFYKKDHENSPQETIARMATCFSFGDYEFAQRIYNYASDQWFVGASPVQSNALEIDWPVFGEDQFKEAGDWLQANVKPDGLPISCFLSMIADSKEGLLVADAEAKVLSMMGGGVGLYAAQRSPDEKSTGVMAHNKIYDAMCVAYRQSRTRRGSMAVYLDMSHPEIRPFLHMRDPAGGIADQKAFNLNNGVNVSDDFMHAVIKGEKWELVDPKHGPTGRFEDARELWDEMMDVRKDTGEPYLLFIDTVNRNLPKQITNPRYTVSQSNLCVAPETLILTSRGYAEIASLENEGVTIWNGKEWSDVLIKKTGTDKRLIKVVTKDGYELECTPEHKFYKSVRVSPMSRSKVYEVAAKDLRNGDKLIKFDLPVIQGKEELENAYVNGFYSGDGCYYEGQQIIYLYGDKRKLGHLFDEKLFNTWRTQEEQDREVLISRKKNLKAKFFVPNCSYTINSRLGWFAGLLDSDGTVVRNGKTQGYQVGSINKKFLKDTQLMLQEMGIQSKVTKNVDAGMRQLPLNNGTGESGEFFCQESYRLLIGNDGLSRLKDLGLVTHRLVTTDHRPNRECSHFIKVLEVVDEGRISDTYCFTEHKRHMGMFNGMLTGQCSEITLRTSIKRTAVCCLSSPNADKFHEWKDTQMIADLVRFLDNVLEFFIRLAPKSLQRAIHSATKERALGIGLMGWNSYLQRNNIPFESGGFNSNIQHTNLVHSHMKRQAEAESLRLGSIRGEAPDCEGSGFRNSHLFAIAPNASSSSLVNVSPSREPWAGIAFNAQGRAGSYLIKNPHFEKLLKEIDKDTPEVWKSIILNDGSVQHLEFLTEHQKAVYKTIREINPMWIIEVAAAAQKHICQSQSVNIYVPPNITRQEMTDIHIAAWAKGLKSLYYCRSTSASKASVGDGSSKPLNAVPVKMKIEFSDSTCLACEG